MRLNTSPIQTFNMSDQVQTLLTSIQAFRQLRNAKIALGKGAIKASISGRGNDFVRPDGTMVRIFNTNLFPTALYAQISKEKYQAGIAAELKGDAVTADLLFREAINARVSFSVRIADAAAYSSALEIVGMLDEAESTKTPGTKVWVLNNVRPVAVQEGQTTAGMFESPVLPEAKPNPIADASKKKTSAKAK